MSQRLGIAAALLGDPPVLMLDEPVNGLDPEGVLWIRTLLRSLAAEGRTIFLSSHLMSEMAMTADRLIIIGRGRLIAQTTVQDFLNSGPGSFVRVRSPQAGALAVLLQAQGAAVAGQAGDTPTIAGATSETVGRLARATGPPSPNCPRTRPLLRAGTWSSPGSPPTTGPPRALSPRPGSEAGHASQRNALTALRRPAPALRRHPALGVLQAPLGPLHLLGAGRGRDVQRPAAAILAIFLPSHLSAHEKATIDSTRVSLGGMHLSQLAIGLLGVLAITSEYGSGMIRATLAAVPQRRLMLTAKTTVLAVTTLITGILASFAAYLVFQALLPSGDGMRTSLADPGVLRAVAGAGLYLAVLGLLGLGLGTVIRSSAGAVAALFGLLSRSSWAAAGRPAVTPRRPTVSRPRAVRVHKYLGPWPG